MSDSLVDPTMVPENRRKSAQPRIENNFGDEGDEHMVDTHHQRKEYESTTPHSHGGYNGGHSIFRNRDTESREPDDSTRFINISSSHGRLSEGGRRSHFSTDSSEREPPQVPQIRPETVWRDFISQEPGA